MLGWGKNTSRWKLERTAGASFTSFITVQCTLYVETQLIQTGLMLWSTKRISLFTQNYLALRFSLYLDISSGIAFTYEPIPLVLDCCCYRVHQDLNNYLTIGTRHQCSFVLHNFFSLKTAKHYEDNGAESLLTTFSS